MKKKQGTLFSFFSKKPSATTATKTPIAAAATSPPLLSSNPSSSSNKKKLTSSSSRPLSNPYLKKTPSAASKEPARTSATVSNGRAAAKQLSHKEKLLSQLKIGSAISVHWPDDNEYYNAKIASRTNSHSDTNENTNTNDANDEHIYTLIYDDGEIEYNINLRNEDFRILDISASQGSLSVVSQEEDEGADGSGGDDGDHGPVSRSTLSNKKSKENSKKRKIIEESDEEAEFDDDDDDDVSDASEFIADMDVDADDDDDDISMKMTDDEEEDKIEDVDEDEDVISSKPKHHKKRVRVTRLKDDKTKSGGGTTKDRNEKVGPSFITPPPKKKKSLSAQSNSFSSFASGKQSSNNSIREITPLSSLSKKSTPAPPSTTNRPPDTVKIPFPQQGVVNQAGTHFHNHYTFLHNHKRRDAKNRPRSHPDYDHRTLKVDYNEIARLSKKLTPAQQQWWEIKARYADTLLLFKTGKFYEIFHMDADIAVQVLGFNYMKGQDAHAGFPESAYGTFCERLVRAGHKVARVEQTETPDMLNQRKKKAKPGKKPKVVNREVCSIVTSGTRTFCYMDDVSCLERSGANNAGIGPLLSIKEVTLHPSQNNIDEVQPTCEYGITIVDAATGQITLGQFADDVLRSRMNTLLTKYCPSEILVENGKDGVSDTLLSLIQSAKNTLLPRCQVEKVNSTETFPSSTAIDSSIREKMERPTAEIKPWDTEETLQELHRRGYFPRASRKRVDIGSDPKNGISRWPDILKACIEGGAELAISSLGAALFYLQRNLIDQEILSMGVIKGYIPPEPARSVSNDNHNDFHHDTNTPKDTLEQIVADVEREEDGIELPTSTTNLQPNSPQVRFPSVERDVLNESLIDHLSLDGTTIANLEILANSHSNTVAGSLWSKINFTKNPCGSRLLRAWLLRPLFRKEDIDRRADAVEELTSGGAAAAMAEARIVLAKCGDIERLLSRVHSMGYAGNEGEPSHHPNERAVLYETAKHTKRKVGDFSKLLNGLEAISRIPEIFAGVDVNSPLLGRIVRTQDKGGLFPSNLNEELDWFTNNFDCRKAAEGNYEPSRGVDEDYDAACDEIETIKEQLEEYRKQMCENFLQPKHIAKSQWKYVNTKVGSKDKYLIELPIGVQVPADFIVKGKRGKGQKQINKYRTPDVEQLVTELEHAYEVMKEGKARGIQMIFSKFDSMRSLWTSASHASAMLDALGALAQASTSGGFCRPVIRDCLHDTNPSIIVKQGRHPCVDFTHAGGDFIPNDLTLGGNSVDGDQTRVLLLSGPNMGGKSTLLRQTCLIAILAQIGCFVPAEECILTPFDRIFTRLGASDRILQGQSTFFVELAETAAALRGATRRSLCIFDELGRGTSTFDGTAIASAAVKHLVETNHCLALFATHYHSLLEDWKDQSSVRLGHMECFVDDDDGDDTVANGSEHDINDGNKSDNITFLYTLGEGSCPKSFGINVARLAGLPSDVLDKAKNVSSSFEESLKKKGEDRTMTRAEVVSIKQRLEIALKQNNVEDMSRIWMQLHSSK